MMLIISYFHANLIWLDAGKVKKFVIWNNDLSYLSKQISLLGLTKDEIELLISDLNEIWEDAPES